MADVAEILLTMRMAMDLSYADIVNTMTKKQEIALSMTKELRWDFLGALHFRPLIQQ